MEKYLMKTSLFFFASLFEIVSLSREFFLQDHPNYTFAKLEQAFYKHYRTKKNDEQIYLKLHNIKQEERKIQSLLLKNP
jgi:hypothetical protein